MKGHSSVAKARTVNVPAPSNLGGTAVKRNPSSGRAARFVRCSTIGMLARSSAVWTGRYPSLVPSMFSESMPTHATSASTSASAADADRYGMVARIGVGAEVDRVVGAHEHGVPSQADEFVGCEVDGRATTTVEADRRHAGDPLEGEVGEIVTVGEPMERHVEIGPRVRADRDLPDVEGHTRRVDLLGCLP